MATNRSAPAAPRTRPSRPVPLALALLASALLAGCAVTLEAPVLDAQARVDAARVPRSADDCKEGGWRELRDAEGNRFRNQGRCVSWVNAR